MRIAWPELIVLIVVATIFVLGAEVGLMVIASQYRLPTMIVAPAALTLVVLDLWGLLRLIDWLFAGPARRAGKRVL